MLTQRDLQAVERTRKRARRLALHDLARELDLRATWNEEQHRLRGSRIFTPEGDVRAVDPAWRSRWLNEAEALREAAETLRGMIGSE